MISIPRPQIRPRTELVCLLLAGLLCAGCGAVGDGGTSGPGGDCSTSEDCPSNQICRSGYCTVESGFPRELDFRFYPTDSNSLPQRANDVTVDPSTSLDFLLRPTIVAHGRITTQRGASPPRGQVALTRSGGPPLHSAPSAPLEEDPNNRGLRFRVELLPGRYDLRFIPDRPETSDNRTVPYPPVTWRDRSLEKPDRGGRLRISDLEPVPPVSELVQINGSLSYTPAAPGEPSESRAPLRFARVHAVGSSGEALTSSTATTNSKGQFNLNTLPPETATRYDLVVGPSPRNPFVPEVRIPSDAITTGEREELVLEGDDRARSLASVDVGQFPKVSLDNPPSLELRFEAPRSVLTENPSWSKFRVHLRASNLKRGAFSRTANLEGDGTLSVPVLPVAYQVRVLPPPNSRLSSKQFSVDAGSTLSPDPIDLEAKQRLTGRLLDDAGDPIDQARIEFTGLPGAPEEPSSREPRPSPVVATTNAEGKFTVWLERNAYRAVVVPPARENLSRHVARVSKQEVDDGDGLRFRVPPPLLVTGRVFGQYYDQKGELASSGLSKTSIEVYADRFGLETKLAEISTQSNGSFYLLLPGQN